MLSEWMRSHTLKHQLKSSKAENNSILLSANPSTQEEEGWGVGLLKLLIWPHASLLHWNSEMNYSEGNVILNYSQQGLEYLFISMGWCLCVFTHSSHIYTYICINSKLFNISRRKKKVNYSKRRFMQEK